MLRSPTISPDASTASETNRSLSIPAACASALRAVGRPIAASTASRDLSAEALTRSLPSGEKRTARADSLCACTPAHEAAHAHPVCRSR